jgi:hypothetical protein
LPHAGKIADQLSSGQAGKALSSLPPAARAHVAEVARASFITGLNHILVVGAIVAACGAVLAAVLVRPQDFVASGPVREPAAGGAEAEAEAA